ncbi:hypothetical protein HYFRA_00010704 [Hymenoscyphus fraxineus]|uniref:Uncharacterized protein n=1 Tax=Hymenoscyphus fraxineus TaxID=746836 RepID=A0A9N9L044_9HELO|nr:hypothetical protein HYFRA_00010704 [Hymenoscyphus fraxineus]
MSTSPQSSNTSYTHQLLTGLHLYALRYEELTQDTTSPQHTPADINLLLTEMVKLIKMIRTRNVPKKVLLKFYEEHGGDEHWAFGVLVRGIESSVFGAQMMVKPEGKEEAFDGLLRALEES